MIAPHRLAPCLLLLLPLLAGCSKQTGVNAPNDPAAASSARQAEVASVLASNPSMVDDEVSASADQTPLEGTDAMGSGAALASDSPIHPRWFWRTITDVDRRFEFAFADSDSTGQPTTAIVTVHKFLNGSFNILVADSVAEGSPPAGHVIRKPLHDHWVRRLLVKRVRLTDSDRPVWRIVATSGVKITSRDAVTRIENLRVQSAGLDTTITDPLAFFRLRRILKLEPGAEVTLTATTLRNDDVVLLYLWGRRVRFHNNGDLTYTATFKAPDLIGLRHVGVNALSHGTLFDETAPYDSQSWIEPYVVHPLEVAAGTPAD
jgi:hypothetical protein